MKINIEKTSKTVAMFCIMILVVAATWTIVILPSWENKSLSIDVPGASPSASLSPGTQGSTFSGPLAITYSAFNHADLDSSYTTANGTMKIYHADGTTLFGTAAASGTVPTGQVLPSDGGMLYMRWEPASTVYLDKDTTDLQNEYLSAASPVKVQGINYYLFPLNVADLNQVSGITTAINLNMYLYVADVSGLSYTSLSNATSADYSGAARVTASVDGRISGMTQKTAFKIVKVEMSMPDAANISMFDNSQIKDLQVTLGRGNGQTQLILSSPTHSTGGTYLQFDIGVSDPTSEYYGKSVVYAATDSTSNIAYTISGNCAGFTASAAWVPTLIITYIGPDGASGTISRSVSFTDT
jgi:hypothetical protein